MSGSGDAYLRNEINSEVILAAVILDLCNTFMGSSLSTS